MTKKLERAIKNMNEALERLVKKFRRQFRFSTLTPMQQDPGTFGHDAIELYQELCDCIRRIKLSRPYFMIGLAESGATAKQRMRVDNELNELLKELKDLRDYFDYVQKHRGRIPRYSHAAGLCTILTLGAYKPNKLVKFNDEPMIKYAESLEDSFKKLVKKELEIKC